MHTGYANVALASRAHRVPDGRQRRLQIDDADAYAEDVDLLDCHETRAYSRAKKMPAKLQPAK
jgi:hypothetical protein